MKRVLKILMTVLLSVLSGLLILLLLVVGGLNLAKFLIYYDYYEIKTDLCENPGLSDGFECQGICMDENSGKIIVSGYMMGGEASRLYVTDLNSDSYYVSLVRPDGEYYRGHAGGVAVRGDMVYVAADSRVYYLSLTDLLSAENGADAYIQGYFEVNNAASFIYVEGDYIYVGEFHNGKQYITDHPYTDPYEGEHFAIVSRYSADEFIARDDGDMTARPDRIYSIRDKVQGICFSGGKVVMSTSYGLVDSIYYIYDEANATDSGLTLDGVPVYFLGECVREISGPAMSEGLDCYNGQVITLSESASDKYIFGKFFFATKIVSLDILK